MLTVEPSAAGGAGDRTQGERADAEGERTQEDDDRDARGRKDNVDTPSRKRRPPRELLQYDLPDIGKWWLQKEENIPLSLVHFDFQGVLGQARPLDVKRGEDRIAAWRTNPYEEIVHTKLWEERSGVSLHMSLTDGM